MKGGLVVPPRVVANPPPPPGLAVAYRRALRLHRRIFVSAACAAAHPDGMVALRRLVQLGRCTTAGSRCRTETNWATFRKRASHRTTAKGRREYVALLTADEINQEPYCTLPSVCRKTFAAFARGIVRILPSRGLRLAGGKGAGQDPLQ